MHQYNLPQEIEVWYVIPAIRRELTKLLTKKHGLSYDKAGAALGITKAAISQYINNKRASNINLHPLVLQEIEKSAKKIIKDKKVMVSEISRILKFMRNKHLSFEVCREVRGEEECSEAKVTYEKYWD